MKTKLLLTIALTMMSVWNANAQGNIQARPNGNSQQGGIYLSINNGSSWKRISKGSSVNIYCIAISGSNIYAGSDGRILFSTNNGNSWKYTPVITYSSPVYSIVIIGNKIFAGTVGEGIFLSSDNGSSWTAVNNGFPAANSNAKIVWSLAVSGNNILAATQDGVFLSTDTGSSWTEVNNGIPLRNNLPPGYNSTFYGIRCLASSGNNIFAGTRGGGIYLSSDNGANWAAVNNGLPVNSQPPGPASYIKDITINGNNIFAATNGGVFLSTDNGNNWAPVNSGLTNLYINAIATDGINVFAGTFSSSLYGGGVSLSSDTGRSWTLVGLANFDIGAITINGSNVFAGTTCTGCVRNRISWEKQDAQISISQITIYPNPFSSSATIEVNEKYETENGKYELNIYDLVGRLVRNMQLESPNKSAGNWKLERGDLHDGMYFYQLQNENEVLGTGKFIME